MLKFFLFFCFAMFCIDTRHIKIIKLKKMKNVHIDLKNPDAQFDPRLDNYAPLKENRMNDPQCRCGTVFRCWCNPCKEIDFSTTKKYEFSSPETTSVITSEDTELTSTTVIPSSSVSETEESESTTLTMPVFSTISTEVVPNESEISSLEPSTSINTVSEESELVVTQSTVTVPTTTETTLTTTEVAEKSTLSTIVSSETTEDSTSTIIPIVTVPYENEIVKILTTQSDTTNAKVPSTIETTDKSEASEISTTNETSTDSSTTDIRFTTFSTTPLQVATIPMLLPETEGSGDDKDESEDSGEGSGSDKIIETPNRINRDSDKNSDFSFIDYEEEKEHKNILDDGDYDNSGSGSGYIASSQPTEEWTSSGNGDDKMFVYSTPMHEEQKSEIIKDKVLGIIPPKLTELNKKESDEDYYLIVDGFEDYFYDYTTPS